MKRHLASDSSRNTRCPDAARLHRLAWFRYQIRRFLHFSEQAARASGVTPQQHQLLLGVAGYTGRGWATISELAEFLQERHNAVVGLVERAARRGLVRKEQSTRDRRFVQVRLTPKGGATLKRVARLHLHELRPAGPALAKVLNELVGQTRPVDPTETVILKARIKRGRSHRK